MTQTEPRTAAGATRPEVPHLQRLLAAVPFLLLTLSYLFTLSAGGRPMEEGRLPWITAATVATLGLRVWWQWWGTSTRHRAAGFVVNFVLTLLLVSMSPLYGVYAFAGYLDAGSAFPRAGQTWALLATGSLNALAQSGGPEGVLRLPWLFGFLLLVNGGLAVTMVSVDRNRQKTVTQLQTALSDLEEAHRTNESLRQQVVEQARAAGMLEERQRLSREIHDTVAQGLIALLRQVEAASEAATLPEARVHLERADGTARDSLAEARRAVAALASPRLDEESLPEALRTLTSGWSGTAGIRAHFHETGRPEPSRHDSTLLRICQEALANAARHSRASRLDVLLHYGSDEVVLEVSDDGRGFDPAHPTSGHGLRGMRERLAAVGGQLTIESSEGGGCTVRAAIAR